MKCQRRPVAPRSLTAAEGSRRGAVKEQIKKKRKRRRRSGSLHKVKCVIRGKQVERERQSKEGEEAEEGEWLRVAGRIESKGRRAASVFPVEPEEGAEPRGPDAVPKE